MNREKIERMILLAETGELSETDRLRLEQLLATSEDGRAYREDMLRIVTASGAAFSGSDPRPATVARIRAAARDGVRRPMAVFNPLVVQSLAYAACLALLLGAWFTLRPNGELARIHEMSAILTMVSEELPEEEVDLEGSEKDQELRALARQLLIMEGLAADDLPVIDVLGEEDVISGEELSPTVLRSHSTDALESRRCV